MAPYSVLICRPPYALYKADLDLLRRNAERGGTIAQDVDLDLRVAQLQARVYVLQHRRLAQPRFELLRGPI